MGDYMTLMGAERVQVAGRTIATAAQEMQSAASTIDSAVRDHRMALLDQQQFLTNFLEQLQEIIVAGNQKRVADDRIGTLRERHAALMITENEIVQDTANRAEILRIEDELTARGHPLAESETYAGSVATATRNAR